MQLSLQVVIIIELHYIKLSIQPEMKFILLSLFVLLLVFAQVENGFIKTSFNLTSFPFSNTDDVKQRRA